MELSIQDIKLIRKIAATEPLKSAILREITPGAAYATDKELRGSLVFFMKGGDALIGSQRLCQSRDVSNVAYVSIFCSTALIFNAETDLINISLLADTIGTCSMLPREKHGVVDPSLRVSPGYSDEVVSSASCFNFFKVYGTGNLYVADLSIIPLHFAAHSQSGFLPILTWLS